MCKRWYIGEAGSGSWQTISFTIDARTSLYSSFKRPVMVKNPSLVSVPKSPVRKKRLLSRRPNAAAVSSGLLW